VEEEAIGILGERDFVVSLRCCPCAHVPAAAQGCRIRNTEHVHGLAVYVGKDTKLMMNSGAAA